MPSAAEKCRGKLPFSGNADEGGFTGQPAVTEEIQQFCLPAKAVERR